EQEIDNVRIRVVSWSEENLILQACDDLQDQAFKDLYVVLVDTGMRVGEALGLQAGRDYDLSEGVIVLSARRRKNRVPLGIPISKRVREVLERRGPKPFAEFTQNMPLKRFQRVLK